MTDETPEMIFAPWSMTVVRNLNRFQNLSFVHPFTCGDVRHSRAPRLVAGPDGWRCVDPRDEGCEYTQNWAHAFMADPDKWPHGPNPFVAKLRAVEPRAEALYDAKVAVARLMAILSGPDLRDWLSPEDAVYDEPGHVERWCCNGNAEECALCDVGELPYPWICAGEHEDTPLNRRSVLAAATERGKISLRAAMRRLRLRDELAKSLVEPAQAREIRTEGHHYLSTSCFHDQHGRCKGELVTVGREEPGDDGLTGLKYPAQCKFCASPCVCRCHAGESRVGVPLKTREGLEKLRDAPDVFEKPAETPDEGSLRALVGREVLRVAIERTEREWICCDPVDPSHELCKKGEACISLLTALLTDDEESFPARSDVLDVIMRFVMGADGPSLASGSVLSEAALREVYFKSVTRGYRAANAGAGAETVHKVVTAVLETRDREVKLLRQRLMLADQTHAARVEELERVKLETRLETLTEVRAMVGAQTRHPIEQIAFIGTKNWLQKQHTETRKALDGLSKG